MQGETLPPTREHPNRVSRGPPGGPIGPHECSAQPRRSHSQSQQTSPCQRWWSRRNGEVGRDRVVGRLEEVRRDQREHHVDRLGGHVAQQRPLGDHRLDVEAVAARADEHEERSRARRRRRPASSSRRATPRRRRRSARCRRGRRCARACRPRIPRRSGRPAPPPRRGGGDRAAWRGRGPSTSRNEANSSATGSSARSAAAGSAVGDHLERVEAGVEVGRPPGPGRVARLDVVDAQRDPVVVVGARAGAGPARPAGSAASLRASSR